MATYGTKFRFRWQAANGAYYEIDIKEKGYSGTVYDRAMGSAPQLKRENNGHIYGTSLDIYAECQVDGEFSSLYTSDPTMYLVELHQGPLDDPMLIWTGFVSPELYSEPDIAPPYDVTIVATDCLGELKLHDWAPAAQSQTILAHLNYLMSFSGLDLVWNAISAVHTEETTAVTLLTSASVDLSYMDGKTCYEALEGLLSALNMCITQHNAQWLLWRATDIAVDSHNWAMGNRLTMGGKIAYRLDRVGSARDYEFWPVGQLSSEIEAAVKTVTVKAPNYYKDTAIKVESFSPNSYAQWQAVSETRDRACWEIGAFRNYADPSTGNKETARDAATRGAVIQSLNFRQAAPAMRLSLEIGAAEAYMGGDAMGNRCKISYSDGATTYYLYYDSDSEQYSWATYENSIFVKVSQADEIVTEEFYLPAITAAGFTLTIDIEGVIASTSQTSYQFLTTYLYGAYLTYASEFAGQQLKVSLSNNAREDLSEIESIFSTWSADSGSNPDVLKFRNGIVALNGSPVVNWQSDKLGAQDYLGFIAMDYALERALPRLVKTGKIFISASGDDDSLPIGFYDGNYDYIIDTFTLDLLESEMDVRMTSLPAASLTVESQERTAIPESGTASSRGRSGSSGGSGGGGSTGGGSVTSVGLTMPEGFAVSGSPITSAGTLAVTLDSGRVLPTTTQKGNWDSAYNKAHKHDNKNIIDAITANKASQWDTAYTRSHTHSNKTALDGVTSTKTGQWDSAYADSHTHSNKTALDSVTAAKIAKWDAAGTERYVAPRLTITKGTQRGQAFRVLLVSHPYIGESGAEIVLMVYSKNNAGKHSDAAQGTLSGRRPKKGWCEARGTFMTPLTSTTAVFDLCTDLPQFIMRNYVRTKGYTMKGKKTMTIATWRALSRGTIVDKTFDGFDGDRNGLNGTHLKYYKRFGIAVRWTNPEFSPDSSKALTNNTMKDAHGNMRYIYSNVAPLDCYIYHFDKGTAGTGSNDTADICFGLAGK